MTNWRKLIYSGSQAELGSLHISGTNATQTIVNPSYLPYDQILWLHDFTGDNDDWKDADTNSNATSGSWISEVRQVIIDGFPSVEHKQFDVVSQSLSFPEATSGTGPSHGLANPVPNTFPIVRTLSQGVGAPFLYTETSDPLNRTYSITSPLIDLTDWGSKKLIFYFYMFGANCGNVKVYTSTSNTEITGPPRELRYSTWPGPGNPNPTQNEQFYSDTVFQIGPGQVQESADTTWNRAEVDLQNTAEPVVASNELNEGYIWIVYESGDADPFTDPNTIKGDFAIGNLFLQLGEYEQPLQSIITAPALEVDGTNIQFHGLLPYDPHEVGALYKETYPDGSASFIKISNG